MAEILSLHGATASDNDTKELVERLRGIIDRIEAGEILPEKWMLILNKTKPSDPRIITTESYDSGLTLSEAVYLLSGAIHDIHEAARCG